MKKYILLFISFFSPFFVWFAIIGIVDPFDYFRDSGDTEKRQIVSHIDFGYLQHTVDYKRYQKSKVILGSSRPYMIKPYHIPENDWIQLSIGGAFVQDYMQEFWYAAQFGKIRKVLIATDFCDYLLSMEADAGRYYAILDLINNPQSYFTSSYVMEITYKYMMSRYVWQKEAYKYSRTDSTFFNSELEKAKLVCKEKLQDKDKYEREFRRITSLFREMKDYCEERNIEIIAITPIIYSGLYDIYITNAPEAYEYVMGELVNVFGEIIDFGIPNSFSCDRNNFSDPYHIFTDSVYIKSLWEGDTNYCRVINKDNLSEIINTAVRK